MWMRVKTQIKARALDEGGNLTTGTTRVLEEGGKIKSKRAR